MEIQTNNINDKLNEIPNYLYKGVVIDYQTLKNYHFFGIELTPPYEPLIDSNGRKVVGDGNEYGIYMSDNLKVARDYYGNSNTMHRNTTLVGSPTIGNNPGQTLSIPSVGIVYKINSRGINAHRPWITSYLKALENNGTEGREFIAEVIPPQNYNVVNIMIGRDFLHDEEFVECTNISLAEKQTKEKMEMRKYRLELFANELKTIPLDKTRTFTEREQIIFRDIFGENGIKFSNSNDIDISKADGIIKYLITKYYNGHLSKMDLDSLIYVEQLKDKLSKSPYPENIDSILAILSNDIKENINRRNAFVERKKINGEFANTRNFDLKNKRMNEVYNIVLDCLAKTQQQYPHNNSYETVSPEMDDFKESDLFEDVLFSELYRKYGYDEASEQEQRDFIRKYLETFDSKCNEIVETSEIDDRPRKGR